MLLHRSIRAQLLALIGASLLSILIFALGSFHFLSGNITAYQRLLNGPLEASRLVDEANLKFKVQVQSGRTCCYAVARPATGESTGGASKSRKARCRSFSNGWSC